MKNSELRGLSLDELKNKLAVEKESYGKLKFAHSITPIENPMKIQWKINENFHTQKCRLGISKSVDWNRLKPVPIDLYDHMRC